jgi:8-oxo-dGTP pyrophosphatase MutT (NUDIX family)
MDRIMDRHFCTTVYVTNRKMDKFLLIKHKKLGRWLPPGGHVDPNELPCTAGERETFEETGVRISLKNPCPAFRGDLLQPLGMQLNVVAEGEHEHMDFIYTAIAEDENLIENKDETDGIGWFDVETILSESFNTFPSVRIWVERIVESQRENRDKNVV